MMVLRLRLNCRARSAFEAVLGPIALDDRLSPRDGYRRSSGVAYFIARKQDIDGASSFGWADAGRVNLEGHTRQKRSAPKKEANPCIALTRFVSSSQCSDMVGDFLPGHGAQITRERRYDCHDRLYRCIKSEASKESIPVA